MIEVLIDHKILTKLLTVGSSFDGDITSGLPSGCEFCRAENGFTCLHLFFYEPGEPREPTRLSIAIRHRRYGDI
jgi:hypothetical protein